MKVSLIITTYNRPDALETVLRSVRASVACPTKRSSSTTAPTSGPPRRPPLPRRPAPPATFVGKARRLSPSADAQLGHRSPRPASTSCSSTATWRSTRGLSATTSTTRAQGRYLQGVRIPLTKRATAAYLKQPFAVRPQHVGGLTKAEVPGAQASCSREPSPAGPIVRSRGFTPATSRSGATTCWRSMASTSATTTAAAKTSTCAHGSTSIGVLQVRLEVSGARLPPASSAVVELVGGAVAAAHSEWAVRGIDQLRPGCAATLRRGRS